MQGPIRVDVAIVGAGIVGLSLGLELRRRGLSVAVIERQLAMGSASSAAAGMLAVYDPQNPPALMPLAVRSRQLYPEFLERVEELSGRKVPLRTHWAMQYVAVGRDASGELATEAQIAEFSPGLDMGGIDFVWLDEASVDPHDLREALPKAFSAAGGMLLEETAVLGIVAENGGVAVRTSRERVAAGMLVNCRGAWAGDSDCGLGELPVVPVKGQMANLRCAPERLRCVVRAPSVYLVPRGDGRVTVGATIERAGFDRTVQDASIQRIVEAARKLLPEAQVPARMDAWAGLRPGTPDGLPILGAAAKRHCWHATGHYRDGILLAPVTACVMAQTILGENPDIALEAFAPERFGAAGR